MPTNTELQHIPIIKTPSLDTAALQFALWCVARATVGNGAATIDPLADRATKELERLIAGQEAP